MAASIADVVVQLDRLAGTSFEVVHSWHAQTVTGLLPELAGQPELRDLHLHALAGEQPSEAEWLAVLEPALLELYRRAYAFDQAYATARASASEYAAANNFTAAGAVSFADSYAHESTTANVESFAQANAIANARALVAAFAEQDLAAYAASYPAALAQAYAEAYATARLDGPVSATETGQLGRAMRREQACQRLADGLAAALAGGRPGD